MGSLAATRSRSCAPIGFCTAKFTPNFARVVAGPAFLRLRRFVLASSSEEADPPCARWSVLSSTRWQATVRKLSGRILQRAADGRGNCAETRNEPSENFRRERLVSVALGHLGRVVHFDHQRVGTGRDGGQTHLRNKFAQTQGVCWIDDDR